jgi:hypothetical protein
MESPPTGTVDANGIPNEGISKESVIAVTIYLDAGPGQTFTADYGAVVFYEYDNGLWSEVPVLTMLLPPDSAGHQRISLGTIPVENRRGRMAPILFGVECSGPTVTLDIMATIDRSGLARIV